MVWKSKVEAEYAFSLLFLVRGQKNGKEAETEGREEGGASNKS